MAFHGARTSVVRLRGWHLPWQNPVATRVSNETTEHYIINTQRPLRDQQEVMSEYLWIPSRNVAALLEHQNSPTRSNRVYANAGKQDDRFLRLQHRREAETREEVCALAMRYLWKGG